MKDVIAEIQRLPDSDMALIEEAVGKALIRLGVDLDSRWVSLRRVGHEHSTSGTEWVRGGTLTIEYLIKSEVSE